jgi:hypothetical protein
MVFMLAPATKRTRTVGGYNSFCKSWACVTSNDGEWKWGISKPDLVKFAFVNRVPWGHRTPSPTHECQPTDTDRIKVTFTDSGKEDTPGWI